MMGDARAKEPSDSSATPFIVSRDRGIISTDGARGRVDKGLRTPARSPLDILTTRSPDPHLIASRVRTARCRLGAAHATLGAAHQVLCKYVQQCGYSGDCAVSRRHLRPAVDTCPGPACAEAHVADNEEPRPDSGTR
jgi:hypothetical protein